MNNEYAQPPVSLPTREQIADALAKAYGWESDAEVDLIAADAVLALFSQIPTTEPDDDESGWPEPHDLPPESPRQTTDEDVAEAQALLDQVVRESGVESMAPGTTFRGQWRTHRAVTWRVEGDGFVSNQTQEGGIRWMADAEDIDPPTIRDVTPPKEDNTPTA